MFTIFMLGFISACGFGAALFSLSRKDQGALFYGGLFVAAVPFAALVIHYIHEVLK